MRWKGIEIEDLKNEDLLDAHQKTLRILYLIGQEITRRHLWQQTRAAMFRY